MTIHTDDFALPAGAEAPRVVSAAATSAREEALERALRPKLLDLQTLGAHLHGEAGALVL